VKTAPHETLLRQLEAHLQEELGAQERLRSLLADQEPALAEGRAPDVVACAARFEAELALARPRTERRRILLAALERAWRMEPGALDLGRIVERAGEDGARLARQRTELRRSVADVQRRARRCARAAAGQSAVLSQALELLVGARAGSDADPSGCLVDREA
jgi:hypothetical protein